MKSDQEVEKQLKQALADWKHDPSSRTVGYVDALRWVLEKE